MKIGWYQHLLTLIIAFGSGAAFALDEPEPDASASATSETRPAATASQPAAASAGNTDDSPFDYEASEQISEDLSVSFPVDI